MASRVLTIAAIVLGLGTGTALALLDGPKPRGEAKLEPQPQPPRAVAPAATRHVAPELARAVPPPATLPAAHTAPVLPVPRASRALSEPMPYDLSPPTDAAAVKAAELACGGSDIARECVRAAVAYESGTVVPRNERKIGIYNHRAFALFEQSCRRREAEGCYALAWLHANGRGAQHSGELGVNFFKRTLELCRERVQPICERLGEKPR